MTKEKFMRLSSIALGVCAVYCLIRFMIWMISNGRLPTQERIAFYENPQVLLYLVEILIFGMTSYMGLCPPSRKDLYVVCGAPVAVMLINFFAEGAGVTPMGVVLFIIALTFPVSVIWRFLWAPKKTKAK